ncbi:tRNA (guanosine(37)-N1)-methyltransferase TrmD [Candidatus Latescibacterota bacterium]
MSKLTIHILTLFPEYFNSSFKFGVTGRAMENGLIKTNPVNIRDSAEDRHGTVDDTPYGGGSGMIMKPDVLAKSLKSVLEKCKKKNPDVIFLTPQGRKFDQSIANKLSISEEIILICGRYRGVDERFREKYVTDEISVGDYVLSGGEPAALVMVDVVSRLIPGVLNDFESGIEDSFQDNLLDCPWYTRPKNFEGIEVPDILLGGNHDKIDKWRREQSLKRTLERRPDLIENKDIDK